MKTAVLYMINQKSFHAEEAVFPAAAGAQRHIEREKSHSHPFLYRAKSSIIFMHAISTSYLTNVTCFYTEKYHKSP